MNQRDKAVELRKLHHQPQPVVFVNAWDAASARIIESLHFPAVATTSAGIAYVEGFPDGQAISREKMFAHVAVIAGVVQVPVTADLEGGYGPTVADAVTTVRGAIKAPTVLRPIASRTRISTRCSVETGRDELLRIETRRDRLVLRADVDDRLDELGFE
jgi:hypothetical protein